MIWVFINWEIANADRKFVALIFLVFFEGLLFFFSIIIIQWDSPRWNLGLLPIPLGKPAATLTLPGVLIKFQDQQAWNVNLFSPTACSSTQTVYMTRLYHCSILPSRPGRQLSWCMKVEWLSLWADRVLTTVGPGVGWPHFLSEWVGGWKRVCFSETDTRFGSDWFPVAMFTEGKWRKMKEDGVEDDRWSTEWIVIFVADQFHSCIVLMLHTLLVRLNPGSLPPLSVCKDRLAARSFFLFFLCFCCSSVTASCMFSLCGFTVVLPSPVILESVAALSLTLLFSHLWEMASLFFILSPCQQIFCSLFHSFTFIFCSLAFGNSHFLHSFVLSPLATVIFSTLLFSHLWQQSFSPLFCSLTFGNSHFLHSFVLSPLATVIFSTLLFSHLWQLSFPPPFHSLTFGSQQSFSPLSFSPMARLSFPCGCSYLWHNCLVLFSHFFHSLTCGKSVSLPTVIPWRTTPIMTWWCKHYWEGLFIWMFWFLCFRYVFCKSE